MKTFSYVSITAQDLSNSTKEILLSGYACYAACGRCDSGLFFTIDSLENIIEEQLEALREAKESCISGEIDEEARKYDSLQDLDPIIAKMKECNANFLFLN